LSRSISSSANGADFGMLRQAAWRDIIGSQRESQSQMDYFSIRDNNAGKIRKLMLSCWPLKDKISYSRVRTVSPVYRSYAIGSAVVALIFSMAKREVTLRNGTTAISCL
jgi:hypothetical protein